MLLYSFLLLLSSNLSLCSLLPRTDVPSQPLSIQMIDSIISRSQGLANSGAKTGQIELGIFEQAICLALTDIVSPQDHARTNQYSTYLQNSLSSAIPALANATADIKEPLDRLSIGTALIHRHQTTQNESLVEPITALRESITLQPRNQFGGLWYYVYPNWSYLDGMYSLLPFYALSGTPNNTDILLQIDLLYQHCLDKSTGLLHHGYDATRTAVWADPVTGSSPWVWGRSLGWYMVGLVELLEVWNVNHDGEMYQDALSKFSALATAIVKAQDSASGGWWQIVTEGGRAGNYIESSSTALFVYALLKGSRLGYLHDEQPPYFYGTEGWMTTLPSTPRFADVATKGYEWLVDHAVVKNANGTLGWDHTVNVCSLNSTASYEVRAPYLFLPYLEKY
jgi:rhamnogalacturonyl hydrolase YesR